MSSRGVCPVVPQGYFQRGVFEFPGYVPKKIDRQDAESTTTAKTRDTLLVQERSGGSGSGSGRKAMEGWEC